MPFIDAFVFDRWDGFFDKRLEYRADQDLQDLLEDMSFEDGKAFNARLVPISRGSTLPNRSVPVESITYDLWETMRTVDQKNGILEPVFIFTRAQTDSRRKNFHTLRAYLEYREQDVGRA